PVGWAGLARPGLLQRVRARLVGAWRNPPCRRVLRRRTKLAQRQARESGASEGAHALQHRLGVGRRARHPAKPRDRRHRPCAAEAEPAARTARQPLDVPQQWYPVVEGRRKRGSLQRAVVMREAVLQPLLRTGLRVALATVSATVAPVAAS